MSGRSAVCVVDDVNASFGRQSWFLRDTSRKDNIGCTMGTGQSARRDSFDVNGDGESHCHWHWHCQCVIIMTFIDPI